MKVIKQLPGAFKSKIELVEIKGVQYVLRTTTKEEVANEKYWQQQLRQNSLPALSIYENLNLKENQLLLEYIQDSPTLQQYITCGINVNESVNSELIKEWGTQLAKIHAIQSNEIFYIKAGGKKEIVSWSNFIDNEIAYGIWRQKDRKTNLTKNEITKAVELIKGLKKSDPGIYSLIHCDLHINNVLIRNINKPNQELVFFDKGADVGVCHPLFDLIIVMFEFIGAFPDYQGFTDVTDCDSNYYNAFLSGYGFDNGLPYDKDFINSFILMRCLTCHPNTFTPYLGDIMRSLI